MGNALVALFHRNPMAGVHPGSHRPLEGRHRWPLGEEGAAQNLHHSGDVGFADRLVAVGRKG